MPSRFVRAVSACFVLFLLAVGVQTCLPLLPDAESLAGSVPPPAAAPLGWSALLSGDLFRHAEADFSRRLGFRAFWVRLDNQISYSLFREASPRKSGTSVVVGNGGWLYERDYVRHAVTPGALGEQTLRAHAYRLRAAQDRARALGVGFLLIVAPSKASVHPEHIPASEFAGRDPDSVDTDFEQARPFLAEAGVNLLDGPALFDSWKREGRSPLFPPTGTHWSRFASWHVLTLATTRLNPSLRRPFPDLPRPRFETGPPEYSDADLYQLCNLFPARPSGPPLPRPIVARQTAVPADRLPRLLWIHDSFGTALIEQSLVAGIAGPSVSCYYFRSLRSLPDGATLPGKPAEADWEALVARHDAVILVMTEKNFADRAWGFLEAFPASP